MKCTAIILTGLMLLLAANLCHAEQAPQNAPETTDEQMLLEEKIARDVPGEGECDGVIREIRHPEKESDEKCKELKEKHEKKCKFVKKANPLPEVKRKWLKEIMKKLGPEDRKRLNIIIKHLKSQIVQKHHDRVDCKGCRREDCRHRGHPRPHLRTPDRTPDDRRHMPPPPPEEVHEVMREMMEDMMRRMFREFMEEHGRHVRPRPEFHRPSGDERLRGIDSRERIERMRRELAERDEIIRERKERRKGMDERARDVIEDMENHMRKRMEKMENRVHQMEKEFERNMEKMESRIGKLNRQLEHKKEVILEKDELIARLKKRMRELERKLQDPD